MKQEEKTKEFIRLWKQFVNRCLDKDIIPFPSIRYEQDGIYPIVNYKEITAEEKEEILQTLK